MYLSAETPICSSAALIRRTKSLYTLSDQSWFSLSSVSQVVTEGGENDWGCHTES
jgi:hypothetical protein